MQRAAGWAWDEGVGNGVMFVEGSVVGVNVG